MKPAARAPLTIRIERLVLDGVTLTPSEARQLQRSLERELERSWLSESTMQLASTSIGSVAAPSISAGSSAASLGRDAARALLSCLRSE